MKMREFTPKLIQEMVQQGLKSQVIVDYLMDICQRHKFTMESLKESNIDLGDVGIEIYNPNGDPYQIQNGKYSNFRIVLELGHFPKVLKFRYIPQEFPELAA